MFTLELYDGFVTSAYFEHLSKIDNKTESAQSRMSEFVRNTSSLPLKTQGTPFQLRVWARIPKMGILEASTYQQPAHSLGVPAAVRAVASALSKKPIAYLIPCHRIIRADGKIGGYRWTRSLKRMLLMDNGKFIL
ncbi:methylated-DNA--[protein]-cysteine S-methyltransferase [Verrucomicrobia bacterium]|nr:methylated-DNA--[protein]-cysteine S-methyltransferase [Verrucomicrobiota bacterium]